MFVQGNQKDEWERLETGLMKILSISPNIDLGDIYLKKVCNYKKATIAKYKECTYVLYYKVTKKKYKNIPILLNLDTGESRIIFDIQIKHKGAIIDTKAAHIFNSLTFGMNIPNI
jgi:hypothetical protein